MRATLDFFIDRTEEPKEKEPGFLELLYHDRTFTSLEILRTYYNYRKEQTQYGGFDHIAYHRTSATTKLYHFEFNNNEGFLQEVRSYDGYFRERGFQFSERQRAVKQRPYIEKSTCNEALEIKVDLEREVQKKLARANIKEQMRYARILAALRAVKMI